MQIGIDLGATKIESVLLDDNGSELHRSRKDSPKDYKETLVSIIDSVKLIEKKFKTGFKIQIDNLLSAEKGLKHKLPSLEDLEFTMKLIKKIYSLWYQENLF